MLLLLLLLGATLVPDLLRGRGGGPTTRGAQAMNEPAPVRTIPDTDVNPYGANFFLQYEAEPWKIDKSLQMAQDAGLGWVKQHFPWEDLELRKGRYWDDRLNKSTWEKYDRIVDTAREHNLEVIARLDRPPPWARKDNSVAEAPPDNFDDYGDFVAEVVGHFKGRIRYYQIWNEPNIYPEWGNQSVSAADYVRLLRIASRRAKEVDPNVRILSAPLAQTLETGPRNLSDLIYLEQMYQAGARDSFDILFANGYGFDRPPDDPPDPNVLNFQRVQLLREIMVRNGDAAKAVWFNEFAWNASPEDFPKDKLLWKRVSESQQAEWTVQAVEKARATWDWAGVFCIWYFRQAGQIPPERSDYYFRMVDVGFTPRPLYTAIKNATERIRVAGPGTYQESNPAVTYLGDWASVMSTNASGSAMAVAHAQGNSATIDFHGSEIHVLTRKGPDAPTLYVTLDGREANRLPRDRQGRSYVDLYSATVQPRALVTVADRLPSEPHVLRMTVGPPAASSRETAFILDGFVVQESEASFTEEIIGVLPWAVLGIGALAVAGFIWRQRSAPAAPPE